VQNCRCLKLLVESVPPFTIVPFFLTAITLHVSLHDDCFVMILVTNIASVWSVMQVGRMISSASADFDSADLAISAGFA